jgi:hypothetical protein
MNLRVTPFSPVQASARANIPFGGLDMSNPINWEGDPDRDMKESSYVPQLDRTTTINSVQYH